MQPLRVLREMNTNTDSYPVGKTQNVTSGGAKLLGAVFKFPGNGRRMSTNSSNWRESENKSPDRAAAAPVSGVCSALF